MTSYHKGELEVQQAWGVQALAARIGRGIRSSIPAIAQDFLAMQNLAVAASVDEQGHVWASLLAAPDGFLVALDEQNVHIRTDALLEDILFHNLRHNPALGLIVIDFRTRQRMRLNGSVSEQAFGFMLNVQAAYSNCQKRIQVRDPQLERRKQGAVQKLSRLNENHYAWIESADTLFIATYYHEGGADASHRGGEAGFVRVLNEQTLIFPDYSGNMMFNTLGNLAMNPQAGLLFIDFETGSTLQLTGQAKIIQDAERCKDFPDAERLIEYQITSIIESQNSL